MSIVTDPFKNPESHRDPIGTAWKPICIGGNHRFRTLFSRMANTYTQIYIQVVFAVQGRESLVPAAHKEELHKYKPTMALSNLVKEVKAASSQFIKNKRWVAGRFTWQEGFGAFSYGHSQIRQVINYIASQPEHHAKSTFRQEYVRFLKKFEVDHDERFIFKNLDS